MNIDPNSWHYRWIGRHWATRPQSLCGYFWKTLLSPFFWLAGVLFLIYFASVVAIVLSFPVWQFWFDLDPLFVLVPTASWLVVSFILIHYLKSEHIAFHKKPIGRDEWGYAVYAPPKPPGLLRSYLSAAHRKVCPLLTYRKVQ